MSRALVESLYPAATALAKTVARDAYEATFPSWAAVQCARDASAVGLDVGSGVRVTIRSPVLVVPGLIGIIVGFYGGYWCLTRARPSVRGDFSWGFSLMWFGTCSAVGLPMMCWVSPAAPLFDELYASVVSFTACACFSAVAAMLCNCRHVDDGDQETHGTFLAVCLFLLIVTSTLTTKSRETGPDSVPQAILEGYYFLFIAALIPATMYTMLRGVHRGGGGGGGGAEGSGGGTWLAIALAGLAVAASSPLFDTQLCTVLGVSNGSFVVAWTAADVAAFALWMQHRAGRAAAAVLDAEEAKGAAAAKAALKEAEEKDEASKKRD